MTDNYKINLVEVQRTQGSFSVPSPGIKLCLSSSVFPVYGMGRNNKLASGKFPPKWKSQRRKRKNRGERSPNRCVPHPFLLPPLRCLYTLAHRAFILFLEPWDSHDIPSFCWLVSFVPSFYLRGSRNLC